MRGVLQIYIYICMHSLEVLLWNPLFIQLSNHSSPQYHPALVTVPYTLYSATKHKNAHTFHSKMKDIYYLR